MAEHVVDDYARWVWFTTLTTAQAGEETLGARARGELDAVLAAAEGELQSDLT